MIAHLQTATEGFLAMVPSADWVREDQLTDLIAELRLPRSPACGKRIGTPVER